MLIQKINVDKEGRLAAVKKMLNWLSVLTVTLYKRINQKKYNCKQNDFFT